MRVRLDSIGCRLNISEMEALGRELVSAGHRLVGPGDAADLYVLNTCAVTHTAARKSRQVIRQLRRANPQAAVVATGCYAELSPQSVASLGVDLVVGNGQKDQLPQVLTDAGLLRDGEPIPAVDAPSFIDPAVRNHTRAFVKVQDGCDNRCTFCIVTVARGGGRSRALSDVVAEVNRLVGQGYQEAVISGVHLGSYGHDLGDKQGLRHLVQALLAETDLTRLRLSSLEPWDLDKTFFELWHDSRLLPHLHLPLQSGCDATLRRMARRTRRATFAALVRAARSAIPDVSITTDVIVGFPGETEAEFAESLAFVEQMAFAKLHIFRYSPRAGTVAARLPAQVPSPVVQDRSRKMHALGARLERAFQQRYLGRTLPVLWEASEPFGVGLQWSGLTANYLRVVAETGPQSDLHNKVLDVELFDAIPGALLGRLPFAPGGPVATGGSLEPGRIPRSSAAA